MSPEVQTDVSRIQRRRPTTPAGGPGLGPTEVLLIKQHCRTRCLATVSAICNAIEEHGETKAASSALYLAVI